MSDTSPLLKPIQFAPGVGPQRAPLLERMGILTIEDLLFTLPRDVLDLTHVASIPELKEGALFTVRGRVVDLDGRQLTRGRTLSVVLLDCDGDYLRGVWFNQGWMLHKFKPQDLVLFSGKVKRNAGRWEMSHPQVQWLDDDDSQSHGGILPRYSLTDGLKMHEMRRIVRGAVHAYVDLVPDALPSAFRDRTSLLPIAQALRGLHLPESIEHYTAGRRRLIFEDLLEFQLGVAMRRRTWQQHSAAPKFPATAKIDARIRRLLPFDLTEEQNAVIRQFCDDLNSGFAMHRLLQADVGAGKTVVAIYSMLVTVAAGYQAVLMAPTELLASQHWQTIDALLAHSRVQRVLLTGQLPAAERRAALAGIESGEIQLIVGTQAVIQKGVRFGRLGLAVIDEQHKFGVMQRAHFAAQSTSTPHTLVMTATPIPRSLCLTQFGDLDLSVISQLPPGRQKVITSRVATAATRAKVWDFVRGKLRAGRQAYIVCPRIEAGAGDDLLQDDSSAEQVFRQVTAEELRGFEVALLHGQMSSDDKRNTMDAFRSGRLQALVSTTVIEVGVDVPNANLMLIQRAESFGLSQLHQLRGRIGRGQFQGYCFLFSEAESPEAVARLQALENYASGFDIAEADFQQRGPGDVLGTRQHGQLPLRVADLARDQALLIEARDAAFQLVASGDFDLPDFAPLKIRVLDRFGQLFELAGSG